MNEVQMLEIAMAAPLLQTVESAWNVMGWENGEFVVVATFSQPEYANLLSLYLNYKDEEDADDDEEDEEDPDDDLEEDDEIPESHVLQVAKQGDELLLEIDKYVPDLSVGKFPYIVKIEKDGRLFSAERATSLDKPMIWTIFYAKPVGDELVQIKSKALYMIFWAKTREAAIEMAGDEVLRLAASGAFE